MRNRSRLVSLALLCLVGIAAASARADIKRFIDDKTIIAAQADLTKVDAAALEAFLLELAKAAGITGAEGAQTPEAQVKGALGVGMALINNIKKAGATEVYLVGDSRGMQRGEPPMVIIPIADDKAAAVAAVIPVPPVMPGRRPNPRMPQVAQVPGVGVVFSTAERVNALALIKPAPRPDIDAAMKVAGAAPIKLAFAFDATMRQEMAKNVPPQIYGKPSTLMTQDFQWLSAAATLPPAASIKAVVQSTDVNTAKATQELIVAMLKDGERWNKAPGAFTKALTPTAVANQVVLALDTRQINELAVAMKEPLARSRQVALRVRSASNMRQILQTCLMHSNENKGNWPADMKALEQSMAKFAGPNVKQILTNPAKPDAQPAYVYVKPAKGNAAASETVVIYESHKAFGEGINVGFADGHVEWVGQKQQFDEMLAKTAQAQ